MKRILVPLLLVSLAGCISDGETNETPESPAGPFLQTLGLVSESAGAGEPSLGVAPDGTWYTNIGSLVHQSKDNGTTWTNLGDPNPGIPNNDPDLAVDMDGVIWESRLYSLVCNAVSVSQDGGATWTNSQAVCNLPVGDRQYVVPTRDCEAFLYWHQVPTFYQTVMRTTDCGTTWLPTGPGETPDGHLLLTEGSSWGGGGFYNPVTDSTFMTYTRSPGVLSTTAEAPGFSVTRDDFLWDEGVGPAFDGTRLGLGLVVGAADDAGNIYMAWGENINGDVAIFLTGSTDDGRTWTDKVRVDGGNGSHVFPAIAAGNDGHVAVAYYEAETEGHPDNAENWTVQLAWTTDFFGNGTYNHHMISDGIVKTGPICISGTTCTSGREFLDYFAIKRSPTGHVGATFNELTPEGELRNWFALTAHPLLGP